MYGMPLMDRTAGMFTPIFLDRMNRMDMMPTGRRDETLMF